MAKSGPGRWQKQCECSCLYGPVRKLSDVVRHSITMSGQTALPVGGSCRWWTSWAGSQREHFPAGPGINWDWQPPGWSWTPLLEKQRGRGLSIQAVGASYYGVSMNRSLDKLNFFKINFQNVLPLSVSKQCRTLLKTIFVVAIIKYCVNIEHGKYVSTPRRSLYIIIDNNIISLGVCPPQYSRILFWDHCCLLVITEASSDCNHDWWVIN